MWCHTLRGCVDWNTLIDEISVKGLMSHPSWVCGLKPQRGNGIKQKRLSHPSWVCGLKHKRGYILITAIRVTPFVGVWIETLYQRLSVSISGHTLRGCVDWNFPPFLNGQKHLESHPSWVCGLKLFADDKRCRVCVSHPSWVCGLKLKCIKKVNPRSRHTLRGCVDWNWFTAITVWF